VLLVGALATTAAVLGYLIAIPEQAHKLWWMLGGGKATVKLSIRAPQNPGEVQEAILGTPEVVVTQWAHRVEPTIFTLPAQSVFELSISGKDVKSQHFVRELLTPASGGVAYYVLELAEAGSGKDGQMYAVKSFLGEPQQIGASLKATESPVSAILPVEPRVLFRKVYVLTCGFDEGATVLEGCNGLNGDFDGSGITVAGFSLTRGSGSSRGTLQDLFVNMNKSYPEILRRIMGDLYSQFIAILNADPYHLLQWARSIQDPQAHTINEPWRSRLLTLARSTEFQQIVLDAFRYYYVRALRLTREYKFGSERAVALMFDIAVQNGGIRPNVKVLYEADLAAGVRELDETARMVILANKVADGARFGEYVRTRKLVIANGFGTVHGVFYRLDDLGITLAPYQRGASD
jgi:hypothetical protein